MADSDVLILQDCCAATSSANAHSKGTTEIIAACGFEVSAPEVGEHSFTRALIEELRWHAQQRPGPISIPFLHNKVLARAQESANPRCAADGGSERRKRTPIYIRVADRSDPRCIELTPLAPLPESVPSQEASSSTQFSTTYAESGHISLEELLRDPDFVSPKVLVSIALQEGETLLQTPDAMKWLEDFPAVAKWVRVEGVYRSDGSSTVLLLVLPVAVWDLLPGDPAISFVAFVRSRNLEHNSPLKADE